MIQYVGDNSGFQNEIRKYNSSSIGAILKA